MALPARAARLGQGFGLLIDQSQPVAFTFEVGDLTAHIDSSSTNETGRLLQALHCRPADPSGRAENPDLTGHAGLHQS